jgi:hypothetical protein
MKTHKPTLVLRGIGKTNRRLAERLTDYDRFVSLFMRDAVLRWPRVNKEFVGREEIRPAIEQGQGLWDYFVQTTHPGIQGEGDTASGRAYIAEFWRVRDGSSHLNYAVYNDRYQRTLDGWKFAERIYEVRYLDTTPLKGSASHAAPGSMRESSSLGTDRSTTSFPR